jgi:4-hydroxybenzoyl-CoA thioesterase/acyl-CoA thioester hydrolase
MTSFRTTRRVEFSHTDAAGIAHFTAFFEFMEQAEHELLRSRDLSVFMNDDAGIISWPRVAAKCEFQSAARFEDVLEIEVQIARLGEKSVTYAFRFRLEETDVASGELTSVCCRMTDQAPPEPIAIPEWFREKLKGSGFGVQGSENAPLNPEP